MAVPKKNPGLSVVVVVGALVVLGIGGVMIASNSGKTPRTGTNTDITGEPLIGDTGDDVDQKDIKECKKGTVYESNEATVTILGKEQATVEGNKFEVCCSRQTTAGEDPTDVKMCLVTSDPDSVIEYEKIGGKYVMMKAGVVIGEERCAIAYDEEGNVTNKSCLPLSEFSN